MNHTLQIIALDEYPAASCSCGYWGHAFTTKRGDTIDIKRQRLQEAFERHCEQALAQEVVDKTTPGKQL